MKISEWQVQVDGWIKKYGIRYFDPLTNMVLLMEEVGELSRLMARVHGEQSFKNPEDASIGKELIADEIADIFFVLTCIANQNGVDVNHALVKNLKKKTERDENRHRNNPKLKS